MCKDECLVGILQSSTQPRRNSSFSLSVMDSPQTAAELASEQRESVELLETPLNYPCIFDFNLKYIFLAIVADL